MNELSELGQRFRRRRIDLGVKQQDLADKSAVSVDVISSLENGKPITTESLVRVLNALGYKNTLSELLPAPVVSPIELQKLQGKERQRVR